MKQKIPDSETVTVTLTKDMPYGEYLELLKRPSKGWKVRCYQKGFG